MNNQELPIKETDDGELFFELPDDLLNRLGWNEDDELKFVEKDGGFLIKKVKYESVQLEFDDDELLKYMTLAHEMDITFNQFVERSMENILNETDRKVEE